MMPASIESLIGRLYRGAVALVVSVSFLAAQLYPAYADALSDAIAQGRALGGQIAPTTLPGTVGADGTIQLAPSGAVGGQVNPQLLSINPSEMFRDHSTTLGAPQDLKSLYGDNAAMGQAGANGVNTLATESSVTGDAYRTMHKQSQSSRPDLSKDPVFNQVDRLYSSPQSLNDLTSEFSQCTTSSKFARSTIKSHVSDIKVCERITQVSPTCTLTHSYTAEVIKHRSGPNNLQTCGPGCLDLWIGTVGDDYLAGKCQIFEEQTVVQVVNAAAVTSATVVQAVFDDYMQIYLNSDKIWSGPNGNFPPETAGSCELATNWVLTPNVDVTRFFQQDQSITFKTRVSVSGEGEGYARIRITYDPNKAVKNDKWTASNPSCGATVQAFNDGFCSGSIQCGSMPQVNGAGCTTINGVVVCPDNVAAPPVPGGMVPGISNLCKKVTIGGSCNFFQGQMACYTDINGNTQCPVNNGSNLNSCATYQNNPRCGFVRSECMRGAEGTDSTCYVQNEVWDCGYDVETPTITSTQVTDCAGPVRCMGSECTEVKKETNSDFSRAAAALQAARFMAMDNGCTNNNGQSNTACTIFDGQDMSCKKAVGGVVDCCESKGGVSLTDYISLIMAIDKTDSAVMALDDANAVKGAWQTLRDPISDGYNSISEPLTEAWESVWDGTEAADVSLNPFEIIGDVKEAIMDQTVEWTTEIFGEATRDMLFEQTASGAWELGGLIGTPLGWIMTAYMVYQVVMILIKIIFACEMEEFQLQAKRQMKVCHYVGSYCKTSVVGACIESRDSFCCFNSPLSRILQEQVRPQLGRSWGDPEHPDCGGLRPEDLSNVDFNAVDLSEWLGILSSTGHLPDASSINLDRLTGSGSALNSSGQRKDTATRTQERLTGISAGEVRARTDNTLRNHP